QILVKMGLLPAFDKNYTVQSSTVFYNDKGFRDAWVYLKINAASKCIFTRGMDKIYLPVRHGEGKFIPGDKNALDRLWKNGHVVMQYADANYQPSIQYPWNPNGSVDSIAGICDETGRVFGLMPHPEAFNHITNHPHFAKISQEHRRKGKPLPEEGDGIKVWRNAVEYAKEKLV